MRSFLTLNNRVDGVVDGPPLPLALPFIIAAALSTFATFARADRGSLEYLDRVRLIKDTIAPDFARRFPETTLSIGQLNGGAAVAFWTPEPWEFAVLRRRYAPGVRIQGALVTVTFTGRHANGSRPNRCVSQLADHADF